MSWRCMRASLFILSLFVLLPVAVAGQEPCPGNLLANAGMEEGSRSTAGLGTRPSSVVANDWTPWSVWGYAAGSCEAEFDMEDVSKLGHYSLYRVHSGGFSQKFSTIYGVHTAGMYQRLAVVRGSQVTFSIWVQIYTGNAQIRSDANGELISDLNEPGNYRAYVGIDPFGEVPPGFGAGPSERTVWSEPVVDRETRRFTSDGLPYDAWIQLKVTARAEADHVTVYTKGQPEWPVRVNVSYWDDGCVTFVAPRPSLTATGQATATLPPTPSPTATATAQPTETPLPTATALPTATPLPTQALVPSATLTLRPTETAMPTITLAPTRTVTKMAPVVQPGDEGSHPPFLLLAFGAVWLTAAGYTGWSLWNRRRAAQHERGKGT
ncbi:MAG: hypothetical protein FJ026_01915 [Chloroflexi bacterium]|nr:hypothetical protein [Chloroflexota bacterium]